MNPGFRPGLPTFKSRSTSLRAGTLGLVEFCWDNRCLDDAWDRVVY